MGIRLSASEKTLLGAVKDRDDRLCLKNIRRVVERLWAAGTPRIIQDFTDHGILHYQRIAQYAVNILHSNQIIPLSSDEAFLLLAGIYLHDVGMQCDLSTEDGHKIQAIAVRRGAKFSHPITAVAASNYSIDEQKTVRNNHHYLSAAWIEYAQKNQSTVLANPISQIPYLLISDLIDVCLHHTTLPISKVDRKLSGGRPGRKQAVAAILRFADELDIASNRVNIEVVTQFSMSPERAVYWWLHHHTEVAYTSPNSFRITVMLNNKDYQKFAPLVKSVYLDRFHEKNRETLEILAEHYAVVLDAYGGVQKLDSAKCIPEPIQEALQKMANASESDSDPRIQFVVVLSGTIDDLDKPLLAAIIANFEERTGKKLTVTEVSAGSIKLTIEGTLSDFNMLSQQFESGKLPIVEGFEVLDIRTAKSQNVSEETPISQFPLAISLNSHDLRSGQETNRRSPVSGTISFLFTETEYRDGALEDDQLLLQSALDGYDKLMKEATEQHGGTVFKTMGNASYAAFESSDSAVRAAVSIQVAMQRMEWSKELFLNVRMAIHSGTAQFKNNDYFGGTANKVARLLAIGTGGQILLSNAAYALTTLSLHSDHISFLDMNTHRLKDLLAEEHVWQACHPDLPDKFAPLRSLNSFRNNLPSLPTSIIGRDKETAEIKEMLGSARLVSLVGAGGVGKTRLALQVAAEMVDEHPDGVMLVRLELVSDPQLISQTVAEVLGVIEENNVPIRKTLIDYLKPKRLALILDNCEHLSVGAAEFANLILISCPYIKLLVTSQKPLDTPGEELYQIDGLSFPNSSTSLSPAALHDCDAVKLFLARARAVDRNFPVDSPTLETIGRVCEKLDGMPLAIELAASRVRTMPVAMILAQRSSELARSLDSSISWSYNLLNESQKTLLRQVGVFSGGWTQTAIEWICDSSSDSNHNNLHETLVELINFCLVEFRPWRDSGRYRLLQIVRQYVQSKLTRDEANTISERHLQYYLNLVEEAEPHLSGPHRDTWSNRLETEHNNVRAALGWCQSYAGHEEDQLRLAGTMYHFWEERGYMEEGRTWLESACVRAKLSNVGGRALAKALNGLGALTTVQGDYKKAKEYLLESQQIRQDAGDLTGVAETLNNLGYAATRSGDVEEAQQHHEAALAYYKSLSDPLGEAASLNYLGQAKQQSGHYSEARRYHNQSLNIYRELNNSIGEANALFGLGYVEFKELNYEEARKLFSEGLEVSRQLSNKLSIAHQMHVLAHVERCLGNYERAEELYQDSLGRFKELGVRFGIAHSLHNLGHLYRSRKLYARAHSLYHESSALFLGMADDEGLAFSLEDFAGLAAAQEHFDVSARYYGAADGLREKIKQPLSPADIDLYGSYLQLVKGRLGDQFDYFWSEGRTQPYIELVKQARNSRS